MIWLRAALLVMLMACSAAAQRRVSVIIDTSGSMTNMDSPRYTAQIAKILGDLTDPEDSYTIVRLPPTDGEIDTCGAPPQASLRLAMRPGDYGGFKSDLDRFTGYGGGNKFAPTVHTALEALSYDTKYQRLLLFLADSGGLGNCKDSLTTELRRLRDSGALVAAVNLGDSAGGFEGNPAFHFTRAARDSGELIAAVAEIYQKFLGSRAMQSGRLSGEVSVDLGPFVKEAYLVVAVDGPISSLEPGAGNPSAKAVDLNFRGGGTTVGLDRVGRAYRIVKLTHPQGGRWRFRAGAASGGWMLLQESAIGMRAVSDPSAGQDSAIEFELIDERTGERIVDPVVLSGWQAEVEIDGKSVRLRDDGASGDRKAGDGVFTAPHRFDREGEHLVTARLRGGDVDRLVSIKVNVRKPGWKLEPLLPGRTLVGESVLLKVRVTPETGGASPAEKIGQIQVGVGVGSPLFANDNGRDGDEAAGDGVYTTFWTPQKTGNASINFIPPDETRAKKVTGDLFVFGYLTYEGEPPPVNLGAGKSGDTLGGLLSLAGAKIVGDIELPIKTDLDLRRVDLEIFTDSGWRPLGAKALAVRLSPGGAMTHELRARIRSCPQACGPDEQHFLTLEAPAPDGSVRELRVPLRVEVAPDSFIDCHWWKLISAAGLLLTGVIIYGYASPSRFGPLAGVQLSSEADLEEGFFLQIRRQPGSGVGFYRDARVFIRDDYRVCGSKGNALVRLRAHKRGMRIEPVGGRAIWRETIDGGWEELPLGETSARNGAVYRNDEGTLYFELRAGS